MEYRITKYPDGSSYATIDFQKGSVFTFRINSYEDLWHLGQILEVYENKGVRSLVIIPNLLDAQADRRFLDNQSSGLKMVADFLNSFTKATYNIFHPHNPEVVEALFNNVGIRSNREFILDVLNEYGIFGEKEAMGTILMSSDAGGFKPLAKLCDKIKWNGGFSSASKSRKWVYGDERSELVQMVDRDDYGGQDVIIVDDICVYGGTFKGLSKLLRERNVGKLYLAVSHMTIQNHKGNDTVFKYFDRVFTTNSKYDEYFVEDSKGNPVKPDNLEIIKLFNI